VKDDISIQIQVLMEKGVFTNNMVPFMNNIAVKSGSGFRPIIHDIQTGVGHGKAWHSSVLLLP
jgi:hypothetical protein